MPDTERSRRTERVPLAMTPEELRDLEDWMAEHRVFNRSEALRRLVFESLERYRANGRGAAAPAPAAKPTRRRRP